MIIVALEMLGMGGEGGLDRLVAIVRACARTRRYTHAAIHTPLIYATARPLHLRV